ncbi:MAG: nitroreductase [Pigmentiphaga sp.]
MSAILTEPVYDTLLQILQQRYSCRAYQPEPVPRHVIEQILAAAQRTASSCNSQPWHVHIVGGAAREALSERLYREASENPPTEGDYDNPVRFVDHYRDRRFICGMQLYDSVSIERQDKESRGRQMLENYRFFGAPHVALIFNEADLGTYGVLDCGAYATNFMNAATSLDLGCVPQAAIAYYPDVVREFLGIPESQRLVCAISFGYPDHDHPINGFRTERASIADAAVWHD